jgi:hypothetical protein
MQDDKCHNLHEQSPSSIKKSGAENNHLLL